MPGASRSSILAGGDRLSSLPDCLLHHIMSFMKARQVVQTCVLSTRWEHLRTLPQHRPGGFQDFTDHLIIPNNISLPLLDTFQLHISHRNCYQGKAAARWIHHGIKYNAQEPSIQRQGLSSSSWRLERLSFPPCECTFHEITSHSLKNLILKDY
uniref:F-box domain-containing protein n=1 Tax=Setaria italica TaxID=4555 RepID=K3YCX3_SETIT